MASFALRAMSTRPVSGASRDTLRAFRAISRAVIISPTVSVWLLRVASNAVRDGSVMSLMLEG